MNVSPSRPAYSAYRLLATCGAFPVGTSRRSMNASETRAATGPGSIRTSTLHCTVMTSADVTSSPAASAAARAAASGYFQTHDLHIHVPAGAIPKDGPSAGVTMATALASLISGRKVRENTAMTGELTLTGQVLPIGGLKEKALAAQDAGLERVIAPKLNEQDVEAFRSICSMASSSSGWTASRRCWLRRSSRRPMHATVPGPRRGAQAGGRLAGRHRDAPRAAQAARKPSRSKARSK
jgi:Lon protease-like protein